MMKLKHLIDNKDLAKEILNYWEHDQDEPNLLEYFRISANAVYVFKNNDKTYFLRFAPEEETSKEKLLSELDFLKYLRSNNFPAVEIVLSKQGKELEVINTPFGTYYAVAFNKVSGTQLSRVPLTDDIILGWGKALGKLHKLSSKYTPKENKRRRWEDTFNWMEAVLSDFPNEDAAKKEITILKDHFLKLPITSDNFGLIHYDFEADNIFYDENNKNYNVIDFDDGVYHWYAMDINQALESLMEDVPKDKIEHLTNQFITGYKTEFNITDEMLGLLPVFKRYANLYGYVRVLRSTYEKVDNEPDWMRDLRSRLNNLLNKRKEHFGKTI